MRHLLIGILQHNKAAVTEKCINKIIAHSDGITYDILIIDNGSKDGSGKIIGDLFGSNNNIFIEYQKDNHGVIGGRNLIFKYFSETTKYSHLVFLDNDQFVKPSWLDGYIKAFSEFPECITGTEAWIMASNLSPLRKARERDIGFTYIGCGGMMASREVIDKVGVFDDRFNPAYFEDPDYCMRAHSAGIPVVWNTQSQIDHLPHQTLGQPSIKSSQSFSKSYAKFKAKWKASMSGGAILCHRV